MSYSKAPTSEAWERISHSPVLGGTSLLEQLRALLARRVFPLVLQHVAGYVGVEGAERRRIYALSMVQDDSHLFRIIRKVEGDVSLAALAMARSLAWKLLVRLAGQSERGVWTILPLSQHPASLVSGDSQLLTNEYTSASDSSSPLFWMNDDTTDAADRPVVVASIRTLTAASSSDTASASCSSPLPSHEKVDVPNALTALPEVPGEAAGEQVSDADVIAEVEAFIHKEGDEISGVNAYLLAGLEMARLAINHSYHVSLKEERETPVVQGTLVIDLRPSQGGNSLSIAKAGMELLPVLEQISQRHYVSLWSAVHVVGFGWIHAGLWAFAKKILPPSAAERVRFPSTASDVRKIWYEPGVSTGGYPLGVGADDQKTDPVDDSLYRPSIHASTNTGLQKWSRWIPGESEPDLEAAKNGVFDYEYDDIETVYDDFKSMATGTVSISSTFCHLFAAQLSDSNLILQTPASRFVTPGASRVVSPAPSPFVTPHSSRPSSPEPRERAEHTLSNATQKLRHLHAKQGAPGRGYRAYPANDRVSRYDSANPYFGYPAVTRGGVGIRAANCAPPGGRVDATSRRKRHLVRTLAHLLVLRVVSFPVHVWAAVVSRLPRAIAVALGVLPDDAAVYCPKNPVDVPVPNAPPPSLLRIMFGAILRFFLRALLLTCRAICYPLRVVFPQLARPQRRKSAIAPRQKARVVNGEVLRVADGGA